jgi:uncharacterized protein YidB (DUF937 family)
MGLLDDLVSGVMKGVLGQGAGTGAGGGLDLGAILSQVLGQTDLGSLGGLLGKLQQGGLDKQVGSWLGNGSNLPVSQDQLRDVLGNEQLQQMARSAGIPIDQLLKVLSQHLPDTVDRMSPNGRLEEPAVPAGQGRGQSGSLRQQAGLDDV